MAFPKAFEDFFAVAVYDICQCQHLQMNSAAIQSLHICFSDIEVDECIHQVAVAVPLEVQGNRVVVYFDASVDIVEEVPSVGEPGWFGVFRNFFVGVGENWFLCTNKELEVVVGYS